jgi:hypothetical protein
MEHVFSMQFARGCEFTTKNKKIKTKGRWQISIRKKIVRDPSVFVGPLPSALPPPLQFTWSFWPVMCAKVSHGHKVARRFAACV